MNSVLNPNLIHQEMLDTLHQPDAPYAGESIEHAAPSTHRIPQANEAAGQKPW